MQFWYEALMVSSVMSTLPLYFWHCSLHLHSTINLDQAHVLSNKPRRNNVRAKTNTRTPNHRLQQVGQHTTKASKGCHLISGTAKKILNMRLLAICTRHQIQVKQRSNPTSKTTKKRIIEDALVGQAHPIRMDQAYYGTTK